MQNRTTSIFIAGAVAAALTTFVAQPDADACGGLFCNQNRPVNQAAERIIFSDNEDGTVTAVVQILYDGPSEKFAWVLPVPTVPDVKISSNAAFDALQGATNPQYRLNTTVEGECDQDANFSFGGSDSASGAETDRSNNGQSGGVTVLDSGFVGPYNYDVIEVEMGTPDKVQVALDWLEDNQYDITSIGPSVIEPYLDDGMKLIAFKLTKNSEAGDIRPINITYESDVPMIPIKLTAVAANDNMGVLTWVLGEERAIPINYKSLELNEAVLNWFNPNSNYNEVINLAADEADGHGFATEFAGPTADFDQTIYTEADAQLWDEISEQSWESRPLELIDRVNNGYTRFSNFGAQQKWEGFREVANQVFPQATQETKDEFVQCGSCAFDSAEDLPADFTAEDFLAAVDEFIVAPMRDTQKLLESRPYMTRLYTTMSAAEMTVDPMFDFNADLDDVTNVHVGERIIECSSSVTRSEAPWRAELPSGLVVRGTGNTWPLTPDDDMPATSLIKQDGTSGEGEVVTDNARTIRMALDDHNSSVPGPPGACGCRTVNTGGDAAKGALALALLGFVAVGFRRRRR